MGTNAPFVDKNKKKVFISIGMPMYNELVKGNLHETMNNALAVGFDDIVILDDGSTDGSWIILKQYEAIYPNVRVFRNNNNSVLKAGHNRWKFIVDKMAEKKPDWIVVRAADQIYSHRATIAGGDHFRARLTKMYHQGVEAVRIPLAHLWRSRTWYRADNVWGRDISNHSKMPVWRFDPSYSYSGRELTGVHLGWHHPSYFGYGKGRKLKVANLNSGGLENFDLVILHLGHTTHSKKVLKFKWSMAAAEANKDNGKSILMPAPENMPIVRKWLHFNGYKGFFEFNMKLCKAPSIWYAADDIEESKPIPESMYYTILEYNKVRAEEYKVLYDKFYNTKPITPEIPPSSLDDKPKTRRAISKRIVEAGSTKNVVDSNKKAETKALMDKIKLKASQSKSFNDVRRANTEGEIK